MPLALRRNSDATWTSLDITKPITRIGSALPSMSCFFASRRRHTILQGDWSSDVCSSDLLGARRSLLLGALAGVLATGLAAILGVTAAYSGGLVDEGVNFLTNVFLTIPPIPLLEIGRAPCRERGEISVVAVSLKKKRRDVH